MPRSVILLSTFAVLGSGGVFADDPHPRPAPPLQPGSGLIGRTLLDGKEIGLVFQYDHGKILRHEDVEKPLIEKLDRVPFPPRGVEIILQGQVTVPRKMTVNARLAGGSVSFGIHTLSVDGKEIGSVGDDRQKSHLYPLTLTPGQHSIRWVLRGGRLGNNLLRFEDPNSGKLLPLTFSRDDLKDFAAFPAKNVIRITSTERGWPIPQGW